MNVALIVWVVVALLIAGIAREIEGSWDPVEEAAVGIAFWPVVLAFSAVLGIGWCLLWIGRGPAMLVFWIGERRSRRAAASAELPTARTVKR